MSPSIALTTVIANDYSKPLNSENSTRGTQIPTGLSRTPFRLPEQKTNKSQKALRIPPKMDNSVKIGHAHQAVLPDLVEEKDFDRDVQLWIPRGEESKELEEEYLEVVKRQFEGRISIEIALENLMENQMDVVKSLETIDGKLAQAPQRFKPLANVQFEEFERRFAMEATGLRELQESCMRNYHIAEVQDFYHRYKNYHLGNSRNCSCAEVKVDFEPRWSCTNCTKRQKPSDALCLLCSTYKKFTGKSRPTKNIIFDDEETEKINEWKRLEFVESRSISKSEFEKVQMTSTMARWMKMDLTKEEESIIDSTKLRKRKNLCDKEIGLKVVEQLRPHPIPMVRRCTCVGEAVEAVENVPPKQRKRFDKFELDLAQLPAKRQRKVLKKFE